MSNAKDLVRSAIVTHQQGLPEMAAEILRRVLMTYPGTREAAIAVHYLTERYQFPPNTRAIFDDAPTGSADAPEPPSAR